MSFMPLTPKQVPKLLLTCPVVCTLTGVYLCLCVDVDITLCVMGLKIGLFVGVAKDFVGQVVNPPLIPPDDELSAVAYLSDKPKMPTRQSTAHKGNFGTVAVVGGHRHMGGAVIMASQMAMSMGAGELRQSVMLRTTVPC